MATQADCGPVASVDGVGEGLNSGRCEEAHLSSFDAVEACSGSRVAMDHPSLDHVGEDPTWR